MSMSNIATETPSRPIERRHRVRSFLLLIAAAIMLGTVGVASALLNRVQPTPPLMITLMRLGFSALFLFTLSGLTEQPNPVQIARRDWRSLIGLGLAMAVCQSLFFLAIGLSSVTLVVVISLCSAPLIVAVVSVIWLGEVLTLHLVCSIGLALVGTLGLVVGGVPAGNTLFRPEYWLGAGLALVSGGAYSAFVLLSKLTSRGDSNLQTLALAFGFGTLALLPFLSLTDSWRLDLPPAVWLLGLYMGFVPTGLAYYFIQLALRYTTATTAAIVTLLEPAVAALLAWLWLGETITALTIGGMGLLLSSVGLLARGRR